MGEEDLKRKYHWVLGLRTKFIFVSIGKWLLCRTWRKKAITNPLFLSFGQVKMNLRTLIPESHTDDYLFVLQDSSPGIRDSLYWWHGWQSRANWRAGSHVYNPQGKYQRLIIERFHLTSRRPTLLVSWNNETAAMLVSSLMRVAPCSFLKNYLLLITARDVITYASLLLQKKAIT